MSGSFYDWEVAPPTAHAALADLEQPESAVNQTRVFNPAFVAELEALLPAEADIPTLDDNPIVDATGAAVGAVGYRRPPAANHDRSLKTAIGTVFTLVLAVGAAAVASGIFTDREPAAPTVAPAEVTTSTTSEQPVATTATTLPRPRVVIAAEAPATTLTTYAPTTTTVLANRPPISIDVPALINEALQAVQSTTTVAERTTTTTVPTTTTTPVSTTRPTPTSTTVPTLPNSSPVSTR